MCLCDTTSRKDVHINDRLVSLGLAVFEPDTVDDEASFDGYQLEPTASDVRVLSQHTHTHTQLLVALLHRVQWILIRLECLSLQVQLQLCLKARVK